MPYIKEKKGNIEVRYGTESLKEMFNGKYGFNAKKFWGMSSLKKFSRISINTKLKGDNCKNLINFGRAFRQTYPKYEEHVWFKMEVEFSLLTTTWFFAVMASKTGGLLLKIYIKDSFCRELGKFLEGEKDDDQLSGAEKKFNELNTKLNDMVTKSNTEITEISEGNTSKKVTLKELARSIYQKEKIKELKSIEEEEEEEEEEKEKEKERKKLILQKFNKGCYCHPYYESFINKDSFALIPWLNDRYLVLPAQSSVRQNMSAQTVVNVKTMIGNVNSQLTINNINQISEMQIKKLIQDWVYILNNELRNLNALKIIDLSREVSDIDILDNVLMENLKQYITYILYY